jgi:hypothetical protein
MTPTVARIAIGSRAGCELDRCDGCWASDGRTSLNGFSSRQLATRDQVGNPIPLTAQQIAVRQEQRRQQLITVAAIAAILVMILILSAFIH